MSFHQCPCRCSMTKCAHASYPGNTTSMEYSIVYLKFVGNRCHIHILKSKDYNPPFEVSKVVSTYRYFDMITATVQTIEAFVSNAICHMLTCLRYNALSQNQYLNVISGHLCRVLILPSAVCALGTTGETPANPRFCVNAWNYIEA